MLKYLIVQLDDSAPSFCHYPDFSKAPYLMDIAILREALRWSMKENLTVQFIYPDYELPSDYKTLIDSVYHADIVGRDNSDKGLLENADVVVLNSWEEIKDLDFRKEQSYVLRTGVAEFLETYPKLREVLTSADRLNIVFTDIKDYEDSWNPRYAAVLETISDWIAEEYRKEHFVQFNLLTDRILLDKMNNCNAGDESVTLCPDGKFYVCPAFYGENDRSLGDLEKGLDIKNPQLFRLDHAPICKLCDAWQCRRCAWLNKRLTLEYNTPSHQQCVISHIERNASRDLLQKLQKSAQMFPGKLIEEVSFLDPFDKLNL